MGRAILMVCDFYPPFIGGAELQVQVLSRELARRGHRVTVATVSHKDPEVEHDPSGVTVYRMRGLLTRVAQFSSLPERRYHPPFPDPGVVRELRRLVNRTQPDVVHATGWVAYSCALALFGKNVPLVISARDFSNTCPVRTLLRHGRVCDGPAFLKCFECASRTHGRPKALAAVVGVFGGRPLLARRVTGLHAISSFVQTVMQRDLWHGDRQLSTDRVARIPDVLVSDSSNNGSDRSIHRARLPDLPSEYVLFVGGLAAHKGLKVLLAAYQQLRAKPPLVLIGTIWPDTPTEFPAGVTVLHNVPHDAVMEAWERCLFGVVPSVCAEGLGDVVIEAMSKGKAVVGSRVGGLTDLIIDGENGLLVPPGEVSALAAAMDRLIADPELRVRLGDAGRLRARQFTPAAILPQFESFYERVTGSSAQQ